MVFEHYTGLPTCAAVVNLSFVNMVEKSEYKISVPYRERIKKVEIFQYILKMLCHFCCPIAVQMSCLGKGTLAYWLVHTV